MPSEYLKRPGNSDNKYIEPSELAETCCETSNKFGHSPVVKSFLTQLCDLIKAYEEIGELHSVNIADEYKYIGANPHMRTTRIDGPVKGSLDYLVAEAVLKDFDRETDSFTVSYFEALKQIYLHIYSFRKVKGLARRFIKTTEEIVNPKVDIDTHRTAYNVYINIQVVVQSIIRDIIQKSTEFEVADTAGETVILKSILNKYY